jgi:hypothetical protein
MNLSKLTFLCQISGRLASPVIDWSIWAAILCLGFELTYILFAACFALRPGMRMLNCGRTLLESFRIFRGESECDRVRAILRQGLRAVLQTGITDK